MPGPCPTRDRLAALLRREPGSDANQELAAHLAECPACQAQLESLAGGTCWLEAKARTHQADARTNPEALQRAIRALESSTGDVHSEASAPPNLDFLQPANDPDLLGRFGPYEVIAHIASGGMGIVLKARDPALARVVALKILPPALAANALARARFVREARAAAAVVHEHVVPIYAVDECGGLPYLVMQFIEGRSLSDRIRATGPLRLDEILRIGAQTAAGLAAAHAQGLIHRDVKPGNILLENSVERVKLTDFGLARAVDDAGLTRTGELAGTPEFMSPEQAGNEAVDHRSDLFSFGSVLYAICTGHSPFQASSVIAAVRKVCDARPPPVHEINSTIPRWLSDIVARLMAKSPADRFQSAREVGELLEGYLARVQHGEFGELPEAQISKSAVSPVLRSNSAEGGQVSKPAAGTDSQALPIWKSAIRQVWKPAPLLVAIVALLFFTLINRRSLTSTSSPSTSLPERREIKSSPSAPLQEPFILLTETGTNLGAFARIEDALAAAPAGAVIELCWNGSRDFAAVKLPPKPLVLRAGQGFRPTWMSPAVSVPAISASAALTLEGIGFIMTRPRMEEAAGRDSGQPGGFQPEVPRVPPGLALLAITNGDLRVTHCILNVAARGAPERACIILANVGKCRIENSQLFAANAKAIVWRQNPPGKKVGAAATVAQLTITNCVAMTGQVFWLDLHESARTRMEIARCTFGGRETFYFPPTFTKMLLEVNAHRNVFDTEFVILDGRDPASPALPQWLVWRELENLFSPDRQYVAGPAINNGPAKLDDWNRWWNQTAANAREVQVEYANGRGDRNRNPGPPSAELRSFELTDLRVTEGPPLSREEWSRFGADTANVGPVSLR